MGRMDFIGASILLNRRQRQPKTCSPVLVSGWGVGWNENRAVGIGKFITQHCISRLLAVGQENFPARAVFVSFLPREQNEDGKAWSGRGKGMGSFDEDRICLIYLLAHSLPPPRNTRWHLYAVAIEAKTFPSLLFIISTYFTFSHSLSPAAKWKGAQ